MALPGSKRAAEIFDLFLRILPLISTKPIH
jgi:hypothetical protein